MKLKNKSYYLKDNFWNKDFFTTASSFFLEDFVIRKDASIVKILKKKGYNCIGKSNLDEFSCGGSGLLSKNGIIRNPYDDSRITGGSSSESAYYVSKKIVDFSIGSDTGGSIRCPAFYCGLVGFKPSYGFVSRYGLLPFCSSLDTVGILSSNVKTSREIFNLISKKDPNDLTTIVKKKIPIFKFRKKIAIINNLEKYLSDELANLYNSKINLIIKEGFKVERINFPKNIRDNLQIAYLINSCTDLLSHLNSLQGITYGKKENITIEKKRKKYLGEEVKKRLFFGAYFFENENIIEKAEEISFLVNVWIKKVFLNYDFLIFPSMNDYAPKINEINYSFAGSKENHWSNNLLLIANFSGIPSLNLPIGFINNLPVGININCNYGKDNHLLKFSEYLENKFLK